MMKEKPYWIRYMLSEHRDVLSKHDIEVLEHGARSLSQAYLLGVLHKKYRACYNGGGLAAYYDKEES